MRSKRKGVVSTAAAKLDGENAGLPVDAPTLAANATPVPEEDGKSTPIKSIGRLIELSEDLQASFNSLGYPIQWAYRGQSKKFGTLVPSFQRQFTNKYFGAAEIIERRLIEAFREHYGKMDLNSIPDMPNSNRIGPSFDLRCLSVMQHYEIPTRLLDWTTNFWTAIYFACASDPKDTAELWYYDRGVFDKQRAQSPQYWSLVDRTHTPSPEPAFLGTRNSDLIIELDFHITPRMDQQLAHHTVSSEAFSDHKLLIESLATQVGFAEKHPVLQRILIDRSAKGNILQYLADTGMTASTIFPDVVGLGRFLRWQFESLRTRLM